MSRYLEKAKELRASQERHYNCAQATLIPFAAAAGISDEQAYKTAANFGSGMKMVATCGAVTGGLMALGLFGVDDGQTINAYYTKIRDNHEGFLDCADLLRINKERGGEKKPHCDAMVYECVGVVEEILKERGLIG